MLPITERIKTGILSAFRGLNIDADSNLIHIERPARPEHGDFSSNICLVMAKKVGMEPRKLAEELVAKINSEPFPDLSKAETAGPGFVNFYLENTYLYQTVRDALILGESGYARHTFGNGKKVQLEFVSANPTGPLHVGNGWLGSYGDALARLLDRAGYDVTREYYVNDTGNQIRMLGESLLARKMAKDVPEEGYQGAYVAEIAKEYLGSDDILEAGKFAASKILSNIKATLERIGINYDSWYSQASIEETGKVTETIAELKTKDLIYEKDGAVWLAATRLGDNRDRVLVKANGDATYLAGDLAYHRNKFLERGFDLVIDIFGADHHGQVASLKAGVQALGVEPERLEVLLGQLVSLAGKKMSKRSGIYVKLDELVDEVGPDATRILSLLSSIDQATTLDLDLVTSQSAENPVFYIQYAHARIASIKKMALGQNLDIALRLEEAQKNNSHPSPDAVELTAILAETNFQILDHPREIQLMKAISLLPEVVEQATVDRAPHKVTTWVRGLAADFHGFYHDCRVLGNDLSPDITRSRYCLVEATRIALYIGLNLLGVTAPERM